MYNQLTLKEDIGKFYCILGVSTKSSKVIKPIILSLTHKLPNFIRQTFPSFLIDNYDAHLIT